MWSDAVISHTACPPENSNALNEGPVQKMSCRLITCRDIWRRPSSVAYCVQRTMASARLHGFFTLADCDKDVDVDVHAHTETRGQGCSVASARLFNTDHKDNSKVINS